MTNPIASIVVPVDFGTASANAIALAGRLAAGCGVPSLQLLHAEQFDVPPYFTREQMGMLTRERDAARAHAHGYLRAFGQAQTAQPFTTAVVDGPALDVILHAGGERDLLVMGTHGRRGVSRWWLGSVAERVLRASRRPVIVVHDSGAPLPSAPSVLIVSGDLPPDPSVQHYGQWLAGCLGGRLLVSSGGAPEAAAASDASLLVTRSPWPAGDGEQVHQAERLLRVCTRPVLFVPAGE